MLPPLTVATLKRSRAERLADRLRKSIELQEIVEPLPNTRDWCVSVGVSRNTLKTALKILEREGLLHIEPRRPIRIQKPLPAPRKTGAAVQNIVRIIYYRNENPIRSSFEYYPELVEALHNCGIYVTLEGCTHSRIQEISRQPGSAHELLLLVSLPAAYHRYFEKRTHNSLLLGYPSPASTLSYIAVDVTSCIRHATHHLFRGGHSRISLLVGKSAAQGVVDIIQTFRDTCAQWPQLEVAPDVRQIHLKFEDQKIDLRRFASSSRKPHGILVLRPVSLSLVMTTLLEREVRIPEDATLIALMTTPESIQVYPTPSHYPHPKQAFVRHITDTALRFFETGALPVIHKLIPVEAVPASS